MAGGKVRNGDVHAGGIVGGIDADGGIVLATMALAALMSAAACLGGIDGGGGMTWRH